MAKTLSQKLDDKILKLVENYQSNISDSDLKFWDVKSITEFCKLTDKNLQRTSQKQLETSIYSAFKVIKLIKEDSDSSMEDVELMVVNDSNSLNNSLTNIYLNNSESVIAAKDVELEEQPVVKTTEKTLEKEDPPSKKRHRSSSNQISKKSKNEESESASWITPSLTLKDLGGIDNVIEQVLQLIAMPLKHPEIYIHLGIFPPRGVLLHGPPGCGKTMLASAIAGEIGIPFITISAPSVVSGMSGESEKKIREVFEEAREHAPCILFIDEIDAITPKRETAQREMERRIVAQLLTCMDDLSIDKTNGKPVMIIGATNRPDSIDPALRRAGRFDREICLGVPDEKSRKHILEKMASKLRVDSKFDFGVIAKLSPGFVGADLGALVSEAGMIAVKRIFDTLDFQASEIDLDDPSTQITDSVSTITRFLESRKTPLTEQELSSLSVTLDDFHKALKIVQPSSKREGFATVPGVTWSDIGALDKIREVLQFEVVKAIQHPEIYASAGLSSPAGLLLYGPPGCGKTLLAKAVSNESCCNFISIKGPELLNKYVGESEKAIRQVFARANASAPCVIFFDELDALCPSRSKNSDSQHSSRLVNTLLTEMDGMNGRKQIYVIAATNRPDMIDLAMLRPGRLGKLLYVDLPSCSERLEILKTLTRNTPLSSDVDLSVLASHQQIDGFSGADLAALVREASMCALKLRIVSGVFENVVVGMEHFINALGKMTPSVNEKDRKKYEGLRSRFGTGYD